MDEFAQIFYEENDLRLLQFLWRVNLVWIQFSFSTCYLIKAEKFRLPFYLLIDEEGNRWIDAFSSSLTRCEMQTRREFELGSPNQFPTTITFTFENKSDLVLCLSLCLSVCLSVSLSLSLVLF